MAQEYRLTDSHVNRYFDTRLPYRIGMNEPTHGRTPFGERLLAARKQRHLTQKQVEAYVGIAQSTLAALEKDGTSSGFVVALALLYRVNPYWLALGPPHKMVAGRPAPEWLDTLTDDELETVQRFAENLVLARRRSDS
ncbi:Transcriptional regulator, XRE family [Burkholderia diffusa]|uniref:helix-turn-helix domain-containing protein n=1 Tax=Burkholderia diffusa TaxID=488732 RepID=UPI001CAF9F16|nr:helix-turn-helix transcriptional regulator [Burkholderia diffusa]CAG9260856.1 Transcriptional regulator, XRE family [Burkholderia diffusa]